MSIRRPSQLVAVVVLVALVAVGCAEPAPEAEPTAVPTARQTATTLPTATSSPTPEAAAPAQTPTPQPTPTRQPSATPQPTPTQQPTPTPEPTATPEPTPTPPLFPFAVTDSNGEEITFEEPPERIVAFDSSVVEILFAIGEGHRIVGTHEFADFPPETADIPKVGSAWAVDMEATVALKPDLVFIFFDGFKADLENVGLKVFYQESLSDDFRKVADNIRMWGRITGSQVAAMEAAARFESRVEAIESAVADIQEGPRVFQDEGELWTPGPDTLMGEVFRLLKLQNIAHDVTGYAQLSPEVIVDRDPELIIASYGDTISSNSAFEDVAAVKNEQVFVPQSNTLSVPGPRYVEGIEEVARWAYPDLFD